MSRIQTNRPGEIARLRFFYCGRGDTILVEAENCCGLIDCNLTTPSVPGLWPVGDNHGKK